MDEETIRKIAYRLWEEQGRPHGSDFEHWLQARRTGCVRFRWLARFGRQQRSAAGTTEEGQAWDRCSRDQNPQKNHVCC